MAFVLTHRNIGRSLAVEWVQFARANTVSPSYMATEISDFVPQETKDLWKDKIPMGYAAPGFSDLAITSSFFIQTGLRD